MKQNPTSTPTPADLEETAELPVLSGSSATAPAADDPLGQTATWVAPSAPPAVPARGGPVEDRLRTLTANLRDLEQLLDSKSDQLAAFEREVGARDRRIREIDEELTAVRNELTIAVIANRETQAVLERTRAGLQLAQEQARRQDVMHAALAAEQASRAAALARTEALLAELRVRTESQHELLQHAESRRQLFDNLVDESEQRLAEREARIVVLERELAERLRQSGAQEQELITALAAERLRTEELGASLQRARADIEGLQEDVRRSQPLLAQLESEQQRTQALQAQLATTNSEREAAVARAAELDERIAGLEAELNDHSEMIRALHRQLGDERQRSEMLQSDLRTALEESLSLESQLRTRELAAARQERIAQELQAQLDGARAALEQRNALIARLETETASSAAVLGNIQQNLQHLGQEAHTRLLVRTQGDTGIVHVLGRRTTIGLTPDNDVCVDAHYVSRHHAVILTVGTNTYIEDLNSTNGVYVNGTRVTRRVLAEGDVIGIGETQFRFLLKPAGSRE